MALDRTDVFDKWALKYLDQPTTQEEKDAFVEILSQRSNGMHSSQIGRELNAKLDAQLEGKERTERATRIGCHLWDEEKVYFWYRNQVWMFFVE
jgi:hypothetical protein